MAQISWEDVKQESRNNGEGPEVGFFALKGDGAEATVRIMCDSLNDLEILTVHPITIGASNFANRQVNCLRNIGDDLNKCPLCAAGEKVKQKVFIPLLQYENGEVKAVVWDRPANVFVPMIKSYMDNYGPLSNIMCKIVRHGSGLDTKYDIIPNINPQQYNETNYPKKADAFNGFKALGRMVFNKSAEDITTFMQTGNFPEKSNEQESPVSQPMPDNQPPVFTSNEPTQAQPTMEQPVRYY